MNPLSFESLKSNPQPLVAKTSLGTIEYTDKGTGTVILCLHGAMGGWDQSEILARSLSPILTGVRFISVSRPGYLGTPIQSGKTGEAQADLIAALLDALGIDQCIPFAISGGGYSALHFAIRYPERTKALLLCSTTGGPNLIPPPLSFRIFMNLARLPGVSELLSRTIHSANSKNLAQSIARAIPDKEQYQTIMENEHQVQMLRTLMVDGMKHLRKRISGTLNDIRFTKDAEYELRQIECPTLIFHGDSDPLLPISEHGDKLHAQIQKSEYVVLKNAGHSALFSHHKQVCEAVSHFFQRLQN